MVWIISGHLPLLWGGIKYLKACLWSVPCLNKQDFAGQCQRETGLSHRLFQAVKLFHILLLGSGSHWLLLALNSKSNCLPQFLPARAIDMASWVSNGVKFLDRNGDMQHYRILSARALNVFLHWWHELSWCERDLNFSILFGEILLQQSLF